MVTQVHIDNQPHIHDQDYLSRGKWLLSPQYQGLHRHSIIALLHYVVVQKETQLDKEDFLLSKENSMNTETTNVYIQYEKRSDTCLFCNYLD